MARTFRRFVQIPVALVLIGVFFAFTVPLQAEEQSYAPSSVREEILKKLQDEIKAKKDESAALEEKIGVMKKSIERKRVEGLSLKNQITIIDERLEAVRLDIQSTQLEIETVELELKQLRLEIDEATKKIDRHKEILSELIRTIQRESDRNYLELLLSNNNFSDFFGAVRYLEEVYGDIGAQARQLRIARTELEEQEKNVLEKETSLKELRESLGEKEQKLRGQKDYKENLLDETKQNEETFQGMLADLRQQYQAVENEIQTIERQIRSKLEGNDKFEQGGDVVFSWPTPSNHITAYFHDPEYPFRHVFEHAGVDIRSGQGTAIRAAASGYVARAKRCSESWCYSYVVIVHGDGLSTVYGHLSQVSVNEDQFIGRGDLIGYSGGTPGTAGAGPFVTGPHLHFEIRLNGIPVNPLNYLL